MRKRKFFTIQLLQIPEYPCHFVCPCIITYECVQVEFFSFNYVCACLFCVCLSLSGYFISTCIQCVHVDICHIMCVCIWVFVLMQIFVCLCMFICVCAFLPLCLCVFLCALQAAKDVCVEEKEEGEKRCKSETASKQPAVATASVSLPASLPLLPCLPPLLFLPALNKHTQRLCCQVSEELIPQTSRFCISTQLFVPKLIIESTIAM